MGHLTRLMAYARRAEPDMAPHFVSLSQAVGVVAQYGFSFEYVPSPGATGLPPRRWKNLFTERVSDAVTRLRPAIVVFDGTRPYNGITQVRDAYPEARWVWSRRGMWRQARAPRTLPGRLGSTSPGSRGVRRGVRQGSDLTAGGLRVGPVTLLDKAELDDHETARRALGCRWTSRWRWCLRVGQRQ